MDPIQIILSQETLEAFKAVNAASKFDKWLPVGAAIFGAFVGGVVSYFPNRLLENHKRDLEVNAVRNALITEIKSIISIVQKREYVEHMDKMITQLSDAESGAMLRYSVRVPDHYTRVYQSHVSRIGLLKPELSAQIIIFHQLLESVIQDVTPGGIISDSGGNLNQFRALREIFGNALAVAQQIISDNDARLSKQ